MSGNGSPIGRFIGAIRDAVASGRDLKHSVAWRKCVNCPAKVPPRRKGEAQQLLCATCAEKAANATAGAIADVAEGVLRGALADIFQGKK